MFNRSYSHNDVLSRASMTIQIIDDVSIYKASIFSTNGNVFSSRDNESTLFLVVNKGLDNITDKFTDIVWSRFSSNSGDYEQDLVWGEQHYGKSQIEITKEDINEKANIQVAVYAHINNERTLVAADYISFIDVNDLQGSPTPPLHPKHGDLWLDTSVTPPRLMMWDANLGMWIEITVAGKDRRNLVRNSNFYKKTFDYWNVTNLPNIEIETYSGKKWARLKGSNTNILSSISQKVKAESKAKYSFQMLSQVYNYSQYPDTNALVTFYSVNSSNEKTIIKEEIYDIDKEAKVFVTSFETLPDTKEIEICISGEKNSSFDYVVTNIKLENYPIATEWELAMEDMQDALDNKVNNSADEVFDSLTDGGKMQGLYTDTDEEGKKHYYFSGRYLDARNLLIRRYPDNKETLKVSEFGDIEITAKKLKILVDEQEEEVATESDIAYKVDIVSTNGDVFSNGSINTVLKAIVYKGKQNITNDLKALGLGIEWKKTLADGSEDTNWIKTELEVEITKRDVDQRSTFSCNIIRTI